MRPHAPVTGVRVPFLDLRRTNALLADGILTDIAELIESGAFVNGPAVAEFERAFTEFCGGGVCVGTASGLDALRIGLLATGVGPGDEVIVPALTFVATLEAVTQAGGAPVVVDVSEEDLCIDTAGVRAATTDRTRAIVPVHLYGQLADMRTIVELAAHAGVDVVEDACQAHGATRDGVTAGTSASAAAFSFYPAKNLGAMGDAGALLTTNEGLAATARVLREHGQAHKYEHAREGYTARLDTLQALVLLRKLPLLEEWNKARRHAARLYLEALSGVGDVALPPVAHDSEPVWHLFVIRTERRDALAEHLQAARDRDGPPLPRPRPPDTGVRAPRSSAAARSRWRSESRASVCRCRSSRASPTTQVEAVVEAIGGVLRRG